MRVENHEVMTQPISNPNKDLNPLYRKFLLIISLTLLIIFTITFFLIINFNKKAQIETIHSYSHQLAASKASEIKEWINSLKVEMSRIAERKSVQSMQWDSMANELAQIYYDRSQVYGLMFLILPSGDYFIAGKGKASKNLMEREYFKKILLKNEPYAISKPTVSKSTGALKITIAVPIISNENIVGILGANVNLSTLSKIAKDIKIGEKGYGYILDSKGSYIAHPNEKFIVNNNLIAFLDSTNQNEGLTNFKLQKGITEVQSENGENEINVHINISNTPGWKLGIAIPKEQINAPITSFRYKLLLVYLVFFFIVVLIIKLISTIILIKPLRKLN